MSEQIEVGAEAFCRLALIVGWGIRRRLSAHAGGAGRSCEGGLARVGGARGR